MKIKSRHKLIPAIAMVLVSAVVLSSASYAWFTMSRTVTATGISLTAVAPTNLLIANASTGTFGETTAIADTQRYLGQLIPASSPEGLTLYAPKDSVKVVDAGAANENSEFIAVTKGLSSTSDATETGYFADYNLWLKTTGGKAVKVTIDQASTKAENVAAPVDPKTSIINAVRFAILDSDNSNTRFVGNGIDAANNTYSFAGAAGVTPGTIGDQVLFGKDPNQVLGPVNGTGTGKHLGAIVADINSAKTQFIVPASGDAVKITVRIWIEGQAAACIDKASLSNFNITLGFKDTDFVVTTP